MKKIIFFIVVLCLMLLSVKSVKAADWSTTEMHFQTGSLLNPFSDTKHSTNILTFQHASGWTYGDNFFFVDLIDDETEDGFNDVDYYGEAYFNFSLGKMTGADLSYGVFKDFGFLAGVNAAGDANSIKYLPGVRFSWDLPGFAFLNTDVTLYLDDSETQESNSFMFDVNWAYPFNINNQSFSIEGHAEYIGSRTYDATGNNIEAHVLAQPQIRWDLGKALMGVENKVFAGIEYQYWNNKLGTKNDESAAQGLLVWRF
ncbi:MAG: nucleoside-binding protein [Proteobacteria bacterium]|nr:nucleoside-binding protein [Pseudomonadota bacterium]